MRGRTVAAPSHERFKTLVVCAFLVLGAVLVFGQTVRHDFVNYDDDECVYRNPHVTPGLTVPAIVWALTHRHAEIWAPLTWTSHMIDCQIYGLSAGGHHITNVLLHAATAVLLFLVLRQMSGQLWPSAVAAALFVVHPLRVESVAWVTERKDVLSGLFFMLTLAAYVRYVQRPFSLKRYLLLAIVFTLGLLAKQSLVTLPFVLLLLDYWPLGRFAGSSWRRQASPPGREGDFVRDATLLEPDLGPSSFPWRLVVEKLPLLLLVAVACVVTVWAMGQALGASEHYPLWWRIGNGLISYITYLRHSLYPAGLVVPYMRPGLDLPMWKISGAFLILLGVTLAVYVLRRRCPYLLVGWLWYLGMFVPTIGLVQYGAQDLADRYTYLPQIGLCIALAWGAADLCRSWPHRRWVFGAVAALTLMSLMGSAWHQTCFWRDSKTLWAHTLACTPGNIIAESHFADALAARGQLDDAIAHYHKVLEIDPDFGSAHLSLGNLLLARGQVDGAMAQYQAILKANANAKLAHFALGDALASCGRIDEAIAHYHKALEIQPDYADAHNHLGIVLAGRGRFEEATAHYRKALEIQPDNADASYNLGMALARCGQFDEALIHLQPALKLRPNDAELQNTLGNISAARGQFPEAIAHYRKAMEIQPDDLAAQKNLAWLRATCPVASQRNGEEAVAIAERVNRRCDGKRPDVLDTLAAAYAELGWFPEARTTAHKSLELVKQQNARALADAVRARIALYEAGKPYHEPLSTSAPAKP